ncbi:MAG: hypothetical protein MZU97_26130 [Bacillus subtilis]|nr:hypothetical protein [Bacillus subtilis]
MHDFYYLLGAVRRIAFGYLHDFLCHRAETQTTTCIVDIGWGLGFVVQVDLQTCCSRFVIGPSRF